MKTRIVSAYRPQEAESQPHKLLGEFDWIGALHMMADTAHQKNCEVWALTDRFLPFPHIRFDTHEPQLMLWILEVSLAYLKSDYFDRDTVFLSPDSLVYTDLNLFGGFDLGVTVRAEPKYQKTPVLNSLQWWAVAGKKKLVSFYSRCLDIARELPDDKKEWGADTIPLIQLLKPFSYGIHERSGLRVRMFTRGDILHTINSSEMLALQAGQKVPRRNCVVDFKYYRKHQMADYYRSMK